MFNILSFPSLTGYAGDNSFLHTHTHTHAHTSEIPLDLFLTNFCEQCGLVMKVSPHTTGVHISIPNKLLELAQHTKAHDTVRTGLKHGTD